MEPHFIARVFVLIIFGWLVIQTAHAVAAEGSEGSVVEGSGYSLFDTESIKGVDSNKLAKDPICDRTKRPKITKVEPDEAKPGDRLTIKGENFGSKECFQGVAFSSAAGARVDYKYVDETTVEVTVPEARSGMSFIDIVAGGGNARSKPVLVHAK